jgi:hypothetical protein
MGGEGESRGREWVRRDRMSCYGGQQWILARRGESEGGKSKDKKTMLVKLTV